MNRKQQEAKKYLSQAFGLTQRIESKLNQIEELHNLAAKVTAAYSDMPKSPRSQRHDVKTGSSVRSSHVRAGPWEKEQ